MGGSGAVLHNEEGVDAAGFAYESDVRRNALERGFEEGHVGGSGEGPVLGIPDHEIEDVLPSRQGDNGGVTDSGDKLEDGLVGIALQAENVSILGGEWGASGPQEESEKRESSKHDGHHLPWVESAVSAPCSPCCATASARRAESSGELV